MAERKRPFKGFCGGSNPDNDPRYDIQETINYYLQFNPTLAGKQRQISAMLQRPGLRYLQNLGGGGFRVGGLYTMSDNNAFVAAVGNQVYQLNSGNGIPLNIAGDLGTNSGLVGMSDNAGYMALVDGTTTLYSWAIGATSLGTIVDQNYSGWSGITYQDGVFLGNIPGTPNLQCADNSAPEGGTSGGGPITFSDNNIAVKQGYADIVTGILSVSREVFIWGTQTGETWWNNPPVTLTGVVPVFPFVREDGKNTSVGAVSQATIVPLAGSSFWLGANPQGGGIVYYNNGYSPTRISTHAVENSLQGIDLSQAYAMGIQWQGHYFYILQVPGLNYTWVYDVSGIIETNPSTPGVWCKWTSTQPSGAQGPWLGVAHCELNGTHYIGDALGNLYQMDRKYALDGPQYISRSRTTPYISENLNNIFASLLQVDYITGQGLVDNGVNTQNAVHPRAVLEISRDGGFTWGAPRYAKLHAIGQYRARTRWQQLGYAKSGLMAFRVTVTDPVIADIVLAEIDYEVGNG